MNYFILAKFDSNIGEYFTIDGQNLYSVGQDDLSATNKAEAIEEFEDLIRELRQIAEFSDVDFVLLESASNTIYDGQIIANS